METVGIVLAAGLTAVVLVLAFAVIWPQHEALQDKDEELQRLRDKNAQLEARQKLHDSKIKFLENSRDAFKDRLLEEREEWKEEREQFNTRIDELTRQNQNLAERVASLRKSGLDEGGDDYHVEDAEPKEPLSKELADLVSGIEHPAAKDRVQNRIERMRERGMDDDEIYRELDEEGTVL